MGRLSQEAITVFETEAGYPARRGAEQYKIPSLGEVLRDLERTPVGKVANWCGGTDPRRTELEAEEMADTLIEEVRRLIGEEGSDVLVSEMLRQEMAGAKRSGREL